MSYVFTFSHALAGDSTIPSLLGVKTDHLIPRRYTPCISSSRRLRFSMVLMAPSWGRWYQSLARCRQNGIFCGRRCKGEVWTLKSMVSVTQRLFFQVTLKLTKYGVSTGHRQRDGDTFEERRQLIIRKCQEDDEYQMDEYSDYDFKSLRELSLAISSLLKWEPGSRVSAREALSHMEWVDYRSET